MFLPPIFSKTNIRTLKASGSLGVVKVDLLAVDELDDCMFGFQLKDGNIFSIGSFFHFFFA
jgi:hypothetical protein